MVRPPSCLTAIREHRGHEVDIVALDRGSLARRKNAVITLLGEAKCTREPRGPSDLHRLEHIAALLTERGYDTSTTAFALFSRYGFTDDLKDVATDRVHLLTLSDLYTAP